jgi:hypothetical protein
MKFYCKSFLLAMLIMMVAGIAVAESTLEQFDGIKGRSFHGSFYGGKSCTVCHESNTPRNLPPNDACLNCHGLDDLIEATKRPAGEEVQNPHDNLHWGKDVPCMECHGEHQQKKPMCAGCHSFDYPNFKE